MDGQQRGAFGFGGVDHPVTGVEVDPGDGSGRAGGHGPQLGAGLDSQDLPLGFGDEDLVVLPVGDYGDDAVTVGDTAADDSGGVGVLEGLGREPFDLTASSHEQVVGGVGSGEGCDDAVLAGLHDRPACPRP